MFREPFEPLRTTSPHDGLSVYTYIRVGSKNPVCIYPVRNRHENKSGVKDGVYICSCNTLCQFMNDSSSTCYDVVGGLAIYYRDSFLVT